jgi:hypothetical protein
MHSHLNSMTWFFGGTSISLFVACALFGVLNRGEEVMAVIFGGPILLVVGTVTFSMVTILASRVTSEGHRYVLSLTTGLLYPVCMRGLAWWCSHSSIASIEPPFAIMILLIVLASSACECLLFGAGWLILYGPRYYREYLAP